VSKSRPICLTEIRRCGYRGSFTGVREPSTVYIGHILVLDKRTCCRQIAFLRIVTQTVTPGGRYRDGRYRYQNQIGPPREQPWAQPGGYPWRVRGQGNAEPPPCGLLSPSEISLIQTDRARLNVFTPSIPAIDLTLY